MAQDGVYLATGCQNGRENEAYSGPGALNGGCRGGPDLGGVSEEFGPQ